MDIEKQWIKRIKARGDRDAADSLVSKYYREIYAFVYRQTIDKELSMDLTQEIFISALKTIAGYDDKKSSFHTWLYRVAANKTVDYFRSREYRRAKLMVTDDGLCGECDERDITKALENSEDAQKVLDIINTFDVCAQRILRLKIFGSCTFAEVSAILSVSESTIKSRYYSLIRQIRKKFEGGVKI